MSFYSRNHNYDFNCLYLFSSVFTKNWWKSIKLQDIENFCVTYYVTGWSYYIGEPSDEFRINNELVNKMHSILDGVKVTKEIRRYEI